MPDLEGLGSGLSGIMLYGPPQMCVGFLLCISPHFREILAYLEVLLLFCKLGLFGAKPKHGITQ
jgi:hypothetical protein